MSDYFENPILVFALAFIAQTIAAHVGDFLRKRARSFKQGERHDFNIVQAATLTLLAEAVHEQPMLCIVDDAQWLDEESLAALIFVSRRLQVDRVAMIFSFREPWERSSAFDGLPMLPIRGLDDDVNAPTARLALSSRNRVLARRIHA